MVPATLDRGIRLLVIAAFGALLAFALVAAKPGSAQGAKTICPIAGSQVFLPWNDKALYYLAPGGGFESDTTSWTLSGDATTSIGNETFFLGGSADTASLTLPAGASALSPAFCVETGSPTLRLFYEGGSSGSSLKVEAIYAGGTKVTSVTSASSVWTPTARLPILGPGLKTGWAQLRLTAVGAGYSVDDVYIDPRKGG